MVISGRVQNGVVVFDDDVALPDGTPVIVSTVPSTGHKVCGERKCAKLPLVSNGEPGSIHLTNERIYEILDAEDTASLKGIGGDVPS